MLKIYNKVLMVLFLFLTILSIYTADNNSILWSIMVFLYLVSNYLFDSKNKNLIKYESILFFAGSIVMLIATFTDLINVIPIAVIVFFSVLYIIIIYLKIKEKNQSK